MEEDDRSSPTDARVLCPEWLSWTRLSADREYIPKDPRAYLELENLVTDLVPSEMACLDSSPGRIRRPAVWISREEMVLFLL